MSTQKSEVRTLHFTVTGEGMTTQIRDSWVSDTPKHALKICQEGLGMTTEQALEVITGKKKLIGDTRVDDGLDWDDDNTTEVSGIKLDVETMISRLEKKYIDASEAINLFNNDADGIIDRLRVESGSIFCNPELNENDGNIGYYTKMVADSIEQLEIVYSLVGKSMKDLPINKIRSAVKLIREARLKQKQEDFESNKGTDIEQKFDHVLRNTQMAVLSKMDKEEDEVKSKSSKNNSGKEISSSYSDYKKNKLFKDVAKNLSLNDKEEEEEEEEEEVKDINSRFYTNVGGGASFYITHCSTEKCKNEALHAGWLLPDGTFFGGDGIWIHRGILDELHERDFFKDKEYSSDEDDVQDRGNWIKFSGGEWFIWEHKHKLTKEQVEFIIQYTTEVKESTYFKAGSYCKIHIQVFAKLLDGITQFDSYGMKDESEPIIKAEQEAIDNDKNNPLANFPTVEEVSEIDLLSTVFFMPDVNFIKWLIEYADGRCIIDCGAGSGYTTALINKLGGKCIAVEPNYTIERKMFWLKKQINFHIFYEKSEKASIIHDIPDGKALLLFARPCHSDFVYDTITKNMPSGMEALYISHKNNTNLDLRDIQYTELKHEGTSKNNEFVLSIKK